MMHSAHAYLPRGCAPTTRQNLELGTMVGLGIDR